MSKHSLEVLFDSKPRLKILKFLFRNFPQNYTLREIVNHTQEDADNVRRELSRLEEIGLIMQNPRYEKKEKAEKTEKN